MPMYGGVDFKDVLRFQIKIMMGNQYNRCIKAKNPEDIIVACLRLGWNDAFRHTSKNVGKVKDEDIVSVCQGITDQFKEYARKKTTKERYDYINECLNNEKFKMKFAEIKVVDESDDKALCFGHIQKMFNMAIKLFLCLKICAEQADIMNIDIGLNKGRFECDFAFDTADCPIDSIILTKLGKFSDVKWSKLGHTAYPTDKYIAIQEAITQLNGEGESNLYYDFKNWN